MFPIYYIMDDVWSGSSDIDIGSINKARRKIHRAKGYKTYGKHLRSQKRKASCR